MKNLLVFLTVVLVLVGCSEKVKPEDRFSEYVEKWNDQSFAELYEYLSTETKKDVSKEAFVNRYESIYGDIKVENLNVSIPTLDEEVKPNEDGIVLLPFEVSMDTIAGPITFSSEVQLVEEREEETNWFVNWTPQMIFPQLEEGDEIALQPILPERGSIYARNNEPLAVNGMVLEVGLNPGKLKENRAEQIEKLAELLSISTEKIEQKLAQPWVTDDTNVPITTLNPDHLPTEQFMEDLQAIQAAQWRQVPGRLYPQNETTAHLVGYLRAITADDLEKLAEKGYSQSEKIGAVGLESVFEEELHGQTGWKLVVKGTDKVIAEKEPVNGNDIHLTVDVTVQQQLANQLASTVGTAVAFDPQTGETLALVSSPTYDPNRIDTGISTDERNARFNKAYSPGSTIKPIIAAIGLQEGAMKADEAFTIEGEKWRHVTRHSTAVSKVSLKEALIYSDNIYFAQVAEKIGAEALTEGLKAFGFEEEMGEIFTFPTTNSSISNNGIQSDALLLDTGYGQGELLISPIQLAIMYTAFANDGSIIKPVLRQDEEISATWKDGVVTSEQVDMIETNLMAVVNDPNGTAYDPSLSISIAGKTGTAELKQNLNESGQENGWFVGYNRDNPSIVVAMMIEGIEQKGMTSKDVATKVNDVIEQYVRK
ncbi:penicillin-binding transpeptidase domain-containing protein [Bacillus kexueae]|uniref:penicillin-binding transpeptidase domain-containing protein n=1 Tax=Aeribacillus kexueae TaxID=2078952 RepID=UPI001FB013EB|nr:penicillin-binding transpeptidase domain-containing protein [Bacillus kexueae]